MKTLGLRDIIGPIMVGPSSSHTAGALAIARMARRLCGTRPKHVTFTLHGSFAHTGTGHGTDKALVAGMLGLSADDLGIRDSFECAQEAGLGVRFVRATDDGGVGGRAKGADDVEHPNTVDIEILEEGGDTLDVRGVSIGGGAAVIRRIDGIDVDITGEHTSVVVRQHDERGVLAHIATCLADCGVNIATTRMFRTRKGSAAYTVMETDDAVPEAARAAIERHPAVRDVRVIPAERAGDADGEQETAKAAQEDASSGASTVGTMENTMTMPACTAEATQDAAAQEMTGPKATPSMADDAEARFARCDFVSGAELLARCAEGSCAISQAFREREEALCALDGHAANVDAYLERVLQVMRASATEPIARPVHSTGGLIGGEARALAESLQGAGTGTGADAGTSAGAGAGTSAGAGTMPLLDPLSATVSAYALAVLETNASMGRIVAAPTAGSAGVVPAVLLGLGRHRGLTDEKLHAGLLAAAAVGYLIARNASVSGAEGGCQAEIGSAAAMAAAAAVEIAGGTPAQALAAASSALMSLMGLVCDPVGGLVEVPCQKRNATAATTALVCAQIALSGTENLVGFDETVAAMDAVGRALPFELRESALGGIAAAPAACAWCAKCAG